MQERTRTVLVLGAAQTLAWASSYYLPAMLAAPMAADLGVTVPTVFAAFSAALLVSALLGPYSGRAIDQWGGRPVLMGTNVVFALGLAGLGLAQGPAGLFAAWLVLGIGMGSGLYEAAFAALVRLYGRDSRGVITGITLIAGFASTVGWPLSTLLEANLGWRGACFTWAGLHLLLGLPLNGTIPRLQRPVAAERQVDALPTSPEATGTSRAAVLLALVFAITWFISTAMAAHLPQLLIASGATVAAAVAAGALIGPAQVAARLLEFGLLRRLHPLLSARLATLLHPVGAAVLIVAGAHRASRVTVALRHLPCPLGCRCLVAVGGAWGGRVHRTAPAAAEPAGRQAFVDTRSHGALNYSRHRSSLFLYRVAGRGGCRPGSGVILVMAASGSGQSARPAAITAAPQSARPTPAKSVQAGVTPSTTRSHKSAVAM